MTPPIDFAAMRAKGFDMACATHWHGDWGGTLVLAAQEAIKRGITPEQAGYALALWVEALSWPDPPEGDPA